MQDVRDALDRGDLGYTASYVKKATGSFGKLPSLMYNDAPLNTISADLSAFDAKWRWRPGRPLPGHFTDHDHFLKVRSEVRGPLAKFLGDTARRAALRNADDDWRSVRDCLLQAVEDPTSSLHGRCLIPFDTLVRLARDDHRQPHDLDNAWIERQLRALTGNGAADSVRRGVDILNALHAEHNATLTQLLPTAPLCAPSLGRKTRKTLIVPAYTERIDTWLQHKANGRISRLTGEPIDPIGPRTVQLHRDAINWIVSCQVELGFIEPTSPIPIEHLADPDKIWNCAIAEAQGKRPWTMLAPSTLKGHLRRVFPFLRTLNPTISEIEGELMEDPYFDSDRQMTESTKAFCLDFCSNEDKQVRLFTLPTTLHRAAVEKLEHWDTQSRAQRYSALGLAISATQASIMTRLPLRSENFDDLLLTGSAPHVLLPSESEHHIVRLNLPPNFVKNNVPIKHDIDPSSYCNTRAIVDWFIAGPRHYIPEMFPSAPLDMAKLFCGIGYHRFHRYWCRATALAGVPMTQHKIRHAIASFLLLEDESRMDLVAAILRITEETAERYYAFFDQIRLLRRAHAYLDKRAKALVAKHASCAS